MNNQCERELPRYRSHKEVWALKIAEIKLHPMDLSGSEESLAAATITPADPGYAPFQVNAEYLLRHKPCVGGYYVVYKDGYKSYSPAEPFESGYTLIN